MKKLFCYFLLLFPLLSTAQSKFSISLRNSCNFIEAPIAGKLYRFNSSNDATDIVKRICALDGVDLKFEVVVSNVPNAVAIVDNSTRYIVYSEDFIQKLKNKTNTNWAAVSILAHEIGHHVNQHLLGKTSSRSQQELEADKFSGFVLRLMGASLDDAQAAVNTLCPNDATDFYPSKSARLEAIAVGWNSGNNRFGTDNDYTKFSKALPHDIYAREYNTDHFKYTGSGVLHLEIGNDNKLILSGKFNFRVIAFDVQGDDDYVAGDFMGEYFLSQYLTKHPNFPYYINVPIHGSANIGTLNHPLTQHIIYFDSLTLQIKDENHIQCSDLHVSEAHDNWHVRFLKFN